MARPKLPNGMKKEKINFSISPEAKNMLILMRSEMNISVSEFVEEAIRREYHKMVKKGMITNVPGQMYPIETFPAGEFPSEKEYEFITGYEYRKGNEVMLKKEDPLAYNPNLDQEDDRIDEICPELDEYGIDDTILEPEEDKFDGATFKSENGRIQKFDKESISKIAEAIVTKQYPKECSFYEAQSRTATKYLIMSCMSYLLEFATKKNITLEDVCMLVAAGERVEYWKDDPLNTAYDCLLDEIREYIKKKKVPEPDCLQYYRIAMLGMKHNEVVGNALRAINEYISE